MTRLDLRDARCAEQRHAALDLGAQQAEAAPHTGMTAGCESVQVGAPEGARVRTQRERLDDVRAATDPSVDDQLRSGHEARAFADRAYAIDPSSTTLYNLACFYCDTGDLEKAIETLEEAFRKGLRNPQWIDGDPDMDPIRKDPRVQAILAKMRAEIGRT